MQPWSKTDKCGGGKPVSKSPLIVGSPVSDMLPSSSSSSKGASKSSKSAEKLLPRNMMRSSRLNDLESASAKLLVLEFRVFKRR